MKIYNIGHFSVECHNRVILIKNLLHVPSTSKNLIFVKKFCGYNNVTFEFDVSKVLVKDKEIKGVLLEEKTKDDMYTLPIHNPGSFIPYYAFICEKASINK